MGLSIGWAALIVSIAFFALALLMALVGKSRLSSASLTPKRTINQVKSDIHAVKEMARV
jgi:VIT1/CCC1 family predicted Fe2+/Mn2+ transporter